MTIAHIITELFFAAILVGCIVAIVKILKGEW